MLRVGVEHHQFGERVVLQLDAEVEPGSPRQVVEAVGVLQRLHLGLEDEVEARAEQAAEGHLFLGQAADPEVDGVNAGGGHAVCLIGIGAGAVEEVEAVERRSGAAENQVRGRRALAGKRGGAANRRVRAVGGDEVDQRFRMPQVLHQVDPARVGLELAVLGHLEELTARRVQGRNAGIAATRNIDGRQVKRQANQVVAQGFGHELVDLVADLTRRAANDGARRLIRGQAAGGKFERVEEGRDQTGLLIAERARITIADDVETGVETVHRLGQHRMAEAIDGMRELGDDGRINRRIEAVRGQEGVYIRLDLAREFLEHQVLILHLGAELGGLEQALAVPLEGCNASSGSRNGSDCNIEPLIEESDIVRGQGYILGLLDQPVVLGVEHVVHRGQADVFIDAAIAGDVVGVEQLVVVRKIVSSGPDRNGIADSGASVRRQDTSDEDRHRVVRDVVEEGVAGAHGIREADRRQ